MNKIVVGKPFLLYHEVVIPHSPALKSSSPKGDAHFSHENPLGA